MNDKIICIIGPTAVGKTSFSIEIAKRIDAEIVNADSMQIYKYMDIGTAKPTPQEQNQVKHHLVDIVEPDEDFNVKTFTQKAIKAIKGIKDRGKRALIVGGTGLYIKGLLYGIFDAPSKSEQIRAKIREEIQSKGLDYVHDRLKKIDPISAKHIHPNDQKRIIRAMEIFILTGKSRTELQIEQRQSFTPAYDYRLIGLTDDREVVYQRIDQRCEDMIKNGLIQEVESLRERGYNAGLQSMQAIGYSHVNLYLEGKLDYDEMIRLFKRDSRRYAKRQWTLFNSIENVLWINIDRYKDIDSYIETLGIV
jgi:tRNA dimethylallyltransferase